MLFNLNLSRCSVFWQVVNLDLVLCTGFYSEYAVLFLCHISNQRPMKDQKIECSYGWRVALLLSATTSCQFNRQFHCTCKRKVFVTAKNLQSIKTFLTLELSLYLKSGYSVVACFPKASLFLLQRLLQTWKHCVFASQLYQPKQCLRAAPRDSLLILPSKPSITVWNSLQRDCQVACRGSNLDSNLNYRQKSCICTELQSQTPCGWMHLLWSCLSHLKIGNTDYAVCVVKYCVQVCRTNKVLS